MSRKYSDLELLPIPESRPSISTGQYDTNPISSPASFGPKSPTKQLSRPSTPFTSPRQGSFVTIQQQSQQQQQQQPDPQQSQQDPSISTGSITSCTTTYLNETKPPPPPVQPSPIPQSRPGSPRPTLNGGKKQKNRKNKYAKRKTTKKSKKYAKRKSTKKSKK